MGFCMEKTWGFLILELTRTKEIMVKIFERPKYGFESLDSKYKKTGMVKIK